MRELALTTASDVLVSSSVVTWAPPSSRRCGPVPGRRATPCRSGAGIQALALPYLRPRHLTPPPATRRRPFRLSTSAPCLDLSLAVRAPRTALPAPASGSSSRHMRTTPPGCSPRGRCAQATLTPRGAGRQQVRACGPPSPSACACVGGCRRVECASRTVCGALAEQRLVHLAIRVH